MRNGVRASIQVEPEDPRLPPGYTQGNAIRRFRSRADFDDVTTALNRPPVHCTSCTFVVSRWISFTSLRS
jgi:hypothetical protein